MCRDLLIVVTLKVVTNDQVQLYEQEKISEILESVKSVCIACNLIPKKQTEVEQIHQILVDNFDDIKSNMTEDQQNNYQQLIKNLKKQELFAGHEEFLQNSIQECKEWVNSRNLQYGEDADYNVKDL